MTLLSRLDSFLRHHWRHGRLGDDALIPGDLPDHTHADSTQGGVLPVGSVTAHDHTAAGQGGDYAWADITGFGPEPAAVSSSTSGTAGAATTASRGDHGHDLGTHAHTGATDGGTVAHSATTGQGTDDHHAKSHNHTVASGAGAIASDQNITTTKNVGLGSADIEAWTWAAIEGYRAALAMRTDQGTAYLMVNAYYDGAWKHKAAGTAALLEFVDSSGDAGWYVGATGAADSAITWTYIKKLFASGGEHLGTTPTDPGANNLTVQGGLKVASIVNDTGLASGTYTPVLTNTTNLDGSTAYACQYLRVGNVVTVSGIVDADPTAAGATLLGISLPIASNLAANEDCAGAGNAPGVAGISAGIYADIANNRAILRWYTNDTNNNMICFSFTYRVI